MSDKSPTEVQSKILETVLALAESHSASDTSRLELKHKLEILQKQVEHIKSETSEQTSKLANLDKNVSLVTADLATHMTIETKELSDLRQQLSVKIDTLLEAFPHDPASNKPQLREHRTEHETSWNSKQRWDRRKEKAYEHLVVGATWAAGIFILGAIWEAFKARILS